VKSRPSTPEKTKGSAIFLLFSLAIVGASFASPRLGDTYRVGAGHTFLQTLFELSLGWVLWRLVFALGRDLRVSAALLCCRMNHR
jgi:hypothetical protein